MCDAVPLFSDALAEALSHRPDIDVLAPRPGRGIDAFEAAVELRPDVMLLDYWMDDMEGAAAAHLIRHRRPAAKIIITSWFHGTREIEASLDAGAVGFFPKTLSVAQVAEGILRAHAGESPVFLKELEEMFLAISKRTHQAADTWALLEGLSRRQIEIITLLSMNLTAKEVAKRLSISPQTVKVHLRNVLEKTGAHSYVDVVTMARACGLIRT